MIRYANISADLKEAMLKFCMEQSACVGFEEVKRLVDSAFTTFNRIPEKWFKVTPVFSYLLYMRGNYADEILPNSIKENGVIIERGINLGTFIIDHTIPAIQAKRLCVDMMLFMTLINVK